MNKQKLLIISVLAIFVVAMSLSAVSASKTKTKTFKIKDKYAHYSDLKNGDVITYIYATSSGPDFFKGVNVLAMSNDGPDPAKHTKIVKAKVWYKKKGKIIKRTSKKLWHNTILVIKLVKGYKPYKLKVWYKTK